MHRNNWAAMEWLGGSAESNAHGVERAPGAGTIWPALVSRLLHAGSRQLMLSFDRMGGCETDSE